MAVEEGYGTKTFIIYVAPDLQLEVIKTILKLSMVFCSFFFLVNHFIVFR